MYTAIGHKGGWLTWYSLGILAAQACPQGPGDTERQRGSSGAALPGQQEPAPQGFTLAPPKGPSMSPPSGPHDPFHVRGTMQSHSQLARSQEMLRSLEPLHPQSGLWAPLSPSLPHPQPLLLLTLEPLGQWMQFLPFTDILRSSQTLRRGPQGCAKGG